MKREEKEKKKSLKAILYVSGDSLRVVDETNKVNNNNLVLKRIFKV